MQKIKDHLNDLMKLQKYKLNINIKKIQKFNTKVKKISKFYAKEIVSKNKKLYYF